MVAREPDPVLLVEAHYVLGVALFWKGGFARSCAHLEQGLAHYTAAQAFDHIALYSQDPGVVCLIRLALDLWCAGYPEQAQQRRQQALVRAQELSHPLSLAYVLAWDALLQSLDRKSTRLNSSHANISYAVFCLKKKKRN